jgi:hypothetical protein
MATLMPVKIRRFVDFPAAGSSLSRNRRVAGAGDKSCA